MRRRINRLCIASSDDYERSQNVHKAMLVENREDNKGLLRKALNDSLSRYNRNNTVNLRNAAIQSCLRKNGWRMR